jgi:hypothetical protein
MDDSAENKIVYHSVTTSKHIRTRHQCNEAKGYKTTRHTETHFLSAQMQGGTVYSKINRCAVVRLKHFIDGRGVLENDEGRLTHS